MATAGLLTTMKSECQAQHVVDPSRVIASLRRP
jgi:hypothetical protein